MSRLDVAGEARLTECIPCPPCCFPPLLLLLLLLLLPLYIAVPAFRRVPRSHPMLPTPNSPPIARPLCTGHVTHHLQGHRPSRPPPRLLPPHQHARSCPGHVSGWLAPGPNHTFPVPTPRQLEWMAGTDAAVGGFSMFSHFGINTF